MVNGANQEAVEPPCASTCKGPTPVTLARARLVTIKTQNEDVWLVEVAMQ